MKLSTYICFLVTAYYPFLKTIVPYKCQKNFEGTFITFIENSNTVTMMAFKMIIINCAIPMATLGAHVVVCESNVAANGVEGNPLHVWTRKLVVNENPEISRIVGEFRCGDLFTTTSEH